jgi:hypothetical protein
MRWLSPFALLARPLPEPPGGRPFPAWTPAAFLGAFGWYFLAYHRPGSPRALAAFLVVYIAAVLVGAWRWGRRWLGAGEAFGALSATVARVGLRRPRGRAPAATALLMVVWLASTGFDAVANTTLWLDVLGTSRDWPRTLLNTVGLAWVTAIVGGAYLLVVRVLEHGRSRPRGEGLAGPLGIALVPIATSWFLAHDLTLLLFEGQNFIALVSDPLGRGWDLFGTFDQTIDYGVVEAAWVGWVQVTILLVGHVASVVLFHDTALALARARDAMRGTWAMAIAAAASIAGSALLVLA